MQLKWTDATALSILMIWTVTNSVSHILIAHSQYTLY